MRHRHTRALWAAPAGGTLDIESTGDCNIIEAALGDAAVLPTFEMRVYSGGPIKPKTNPPLKFPLVVDLATLDTTSATDKPALKDHDPRAHVGHITAAETDGKTLNAVGVVSGASFAAREVVTAAKNGFKWQVSFGLEYPAPEFVPRGKSIQVNGRLVAGPVYVVRDSTVREISFLTLGADDTTSARIAAKAAGAIPMTFEQWLQAKGFALADLSDQQKQSMQAAFDAEAAANANASDDDEAAADGTAEAGAGDDDGEQVDAVVEQRARLAADRQRVAGLATIEAKYADQVPADQLHALSAKAISEGWTNDKFELALIRKRRPDAGTAQAGGSRAGRQLRLSAAVVTAAMSLTAGIAETAVAAQVPTAQREQVMNEATSGAMRGFSLHALMDNVIHAAGGHYSGSRKSNDYIRAALTAEQSLGGTRTLEAGEFSSLSLSGILSNVANKGLIAAYTAVEVCWPNFCAVRNHSDFKVHTRYRLDSTGAFRKVAADGELKNVSLTDASYTNQLGTYGAIIALARQMMINDDLGAFMEIPNLLGRMAALRLEEAAFTLLLSNPSSFFATGNSNYMSGASSVLSIDAITTAEQKFRDFVDSNSKPILVSPNRLLVGSALSTTAQKLYRDTTLIADGIITSAKSTVTNQNPHAGKYTPYFSPYLNNTAIKNQDGAAITGQSATAWFMLADPAVRAAIAVAFLNGQRTPTIESSQTEFNTLGMQWRAFHDFGVGMEEVTSAVMSAGA